MSQSQRKNKPPKRKQSTEHNDHSQMASKHLKDNDKASIQLKTTEKEIQDFKTIIHLIYRNGASFNPKYFFFSPIANKREKDALYFARHILFDALSIHIFPVLSLSRHYFNTLESVEFQVPFHPFKTKDLTFLGEFLSHLALLPHLTSLYLELSSRIHLADFEGWGLARLVSIMPSFIPYSSKPKLNAENMKRKHVLWPLGKKR